MPPKYSEKLAFKVSLHIIAVVSICTLIIKSIVNWASTVEAFSSAMSLLAPFFIAIFIAYLVHPLVKRFEKNLFYNCFHIKSQHLRQFLAIAISYIIVIGLLTLFIVVISPQLGTSLYDLSGLLKTGYDMLMNYLKNLETSYPNFNFEYFESIFEQVLPSFIEYVTNLITNTIPKLYSVSMSVLVWIYNIIIAIIISCYILSDRKILLRNIKRIMYAIFSKERTNTIISTVKSCNNIFGGFIVGKFIDSLIIGILCAIILLIFRMPFALLISVIVGITNMIPYFGPIIGAVPGFFILLISSPGQIIAYLLIILALQQFDGNILGPMILGDSTGVRPLWIIFAITVGGSIAGPVGMFLGVPTIGVITFLANNWINRRLEKKEIVIDDYNESPSEGFFTKIKNKLFKKKKKDSGDDI